MLINGKRALAYIQKVHDIKPIEGADNIELVHILGWNLIAKKNEFKEGDKAVYIEIDSKVPETEVFEFLRPKHFNVKTYKLGKFKVVSQGLALPLTSFPELGDLDINTDVTEKLNITYSAPEDNSRKAENKDIILQNIKNRRKKLFNNKIIKWLMRREWGRKLILKLFSNKSDVPYKFPTHLTSKTDEERIENMPFLLGKDNCSWVATEKIDGSSATYILEKKPFNKFEFYVCSRNLRIRKPSKLDPINFYWEMAEKYNIENNMKEMFKMLRCKKTFILQGEIYGPGVQSKTYGLKERKLAIFNVKVDNVRQHSLQANDTCKGYDIPFVPLLEIVEKLPDTMEEMKKLALGNSKVGEGIREGIVYRSLDDDRSFKNVSLEYLLEKHK